MTALNSTKPGERVLDARPPVQSASAVQNPPAPLDHGARDPWFDNVRLVAAILILTGHCMGELMARSNSVPMLYFATWPLRVPLFVIVAGYFSSSAPLQGKRVIALLRNILFVYLMVDLVATVHRGLSRDVWRWEPSFPAFGMWFLLSLFCWRLLLPLLSRIRYLLPIAVLAALGVGHFEGFGAEFSASRTVAFLPLFLLGWKLRQVGIRSVLDRPWVRWVAWAVLALIGAAAVLRVDDISWSWLGMKGPYGGSHAEQATEALIRLAVLVVGALGALALIAVMPRRRIPVISYLGTGSMYIYILHPMIVQQFMTMGYFRTLNSRPELLIMFIGAVALGLALATPPVRWAFRWLVQPRYTWLFRDR